MVNAIAGDKHFMYDFDYGLQQIPGPEALMLVHTYYCICRGPSDGHEVVLLHVFQQTNHFFQARFRHFLEIFLLSFETAKRIWSFNYVFVTCCVFLETLSFRSCKISSYFRKANLFIGSDTCVSIYIICDTKILGNLKRTSSSSRAACLFRFDLQKYKVY